MIVALQAPEGPALEFLVLFLVVLVGPALMSRARLPGIIGLLLGGWAIGPHGLGLIGEGNHTIPELGQFGLLYLMFVAGLELDLGMLRLHRRTALGFGVLTFAVPFVGGVAAGGALGFNTPAALLLGSLVASHTLILYPTVRDAGLGANRAVASAVGATVLTDTLSLVVLAAVSGSETGSGSTAEVFGELAIGLTLLVVVSLLGLPRIARATFRRLGADRSVRFLVALISFLAMAALADVFGIEGIVGAFFAGLALNPLVPNEGQTMHRLEFFGSAVFIPVFLVSTGLLLQPSVMVQPETLGYAALFVLACVGGKALAASLSVPLFRVTRAEAAVMFVLTTPQAAATLAATVVGFEIGLFSTVVVNAVLVLILVSIVVTSLLAPGAVRRVEQGDEPARPLGERVLLAVGAGGASPLVRELAVRVAGRSGGVVDSLLVRGAASPGLAREEARGIEEVAEQEGFDGEVLVGVDRHPAAAIVHGALADDASMVVVDPEVELAGGRLLPNHWAEAMAAAVATPLLLVRGGGDRLGRLVLVRPSGLAADHPAWQFARELAAAIAGDDVVEQPDDGAWAGGLGPGDLALVLVEAWEVIDGVPSPPDGAAVALVPMPSVLGRTAPRPAPRRGAVEPEPG